MDTKNEAEKSEVALREEEMLAFWNERDIFNKSVKKDAPKGDFVFYDGPPFATGLPHYGHILAGTIKDAIPRFWTMNGYHVERKWGWDCHGLPLENIIEKRLGLATKRDIEEMGVKQFNEAAREAVLEYADDWKKIVPRMGRFVDMEDDYRTMDATYTESVWWVFSELHKKGLVYEGFKSMHLCPRCGTTLSNFEVNQGYKDIKDIAVTVKMPLVDEPETSVLIWTTTPWTLPGNMAVAVHRDIEYVKVRATIEGKDEIVILAKARLAQLGRKEEHYEILETMKGSALIGKRYVPPFDVWRNQEFKNKENAWKIYHADYVEIGEEGTGAVHLAPAYGEEDMELAKQEDIPIMHHVGEDGRFKDFVTGLAGQLVKPKDDEQAELSHLDADIEIVRRLKDAGLLFRKENVTHSYPHCWRCDTPLLNYATTSWFVRVTDIREKLVEENAKVKWVPSFVGTNRFGKWLEGARDWAVSRQRYWGAPLPIWKREGAQEYKVFGSLEDLKQHVPKSGNRYFLMRHGESQSNVEKIVSTRKDSVNPLTEKGREQAEKAAQGLADKKIDLIITSPFERAKRTAQIVQKALGLKDEAVISDERLGEISLGKLDGALNETYHEFLSTNGGWEKATPEGGESWSDVRNRVGSLLYELERTYANENILIVSHNAPLRMMGAVNDGAVLGSTQFDHDSEGNIYENAEVRELPFTPVPHNDNFELDFHRPYIDEIELRDTDGTKLMRVADVFDCWFESGSMPYAQIHYPFENKEDFLKKKYPAQFIAEGLDQTRGWFYSLIVLGTALFGKSPFENVIVNGLVLAEDGKKMSKSLQNYPDPIDLANRVGADAMRYYLLSSSVIRAEDLSFSEREVNELQRKNIGRLHNVLLMYEMFADGTGADSDSVHVLDRWMIARLNESANAITEGYRSYELDRATRPLEGLIDDLSVWYLRRSRERLKGEAKTDKKAALATLRHALTRIALLMAPIMPFYAEYLFQRVREANDAESVHMADWPKADEVESKVLLAMGSTREFISEALEVRSKERIKVRQPLMSMTINVEMGEEYEALIRDEVNVKNILHDASLTAVSLNTEITPELRQEGNVRELMRKIQDARKELGLKPQDKVVLVFNDAGKGLIAPFEREVLRITGARAARAEKGASRWTLAIDGVAYSFDIEI
jgi:isoleucyl-tRNA synthetase